MAIMIHVYEILSSGGGTSVTEALLSRCTLLISLEVCMGDPDRFNDIIELAEVDEIIICSE